MDMLKILAKVTLFNAINEELSIEISSTKGLDRFYHFGRNGNGELIIIKGFTPYTYDTTEELYGAILSYLDGL